MHIVTEKAPEPNFRMVIGDIDFTREFMEELRKGELLEAVQAKVRQQRAAMAQRSLGEAPRRDEWRREYAIDPYWYHYWGQREGYEIWSDRKELERFARDTPEIRVPVAKRTVVNGWDGGKANRAGIILDARGEVAKLCGR